MRMHLLRVYLGLVALVLFVSGVAQFMNPQWLSSEGTWSLAQGWQREIAFWNFSFVTVIIILLQIKDAYVLRVIVVSLVVLTALLGTNHLYSVLTQTVPIWHHVLVALNYAGAIGGVIVLLIAWRTRA